MKDFEIREILKETELRGHISDFSTKIVEELDLPVAGARIDIAVINGSFVGYEIKGASDTLKRLPNQIAAYSHVFDYLTIVTESKYAERVKQIAPPWVRIAICSADSTIKGKLKVIRKGRKNPDRNGFFIAKLLWKDELFEILNDQQISFSKKHRHWTLCETLSTKLSVNLLSELVREKLKARKNWKVKEENELGICGGFGYIEPSLLNSPDAHL